MTSLSFPLNEGALDRISPWLALLIAIAIAVVAVIEVYNRDEEDARLATPTSVPSPTGRATPTQSATDSPAAPTEAPATTEPKTVAAPEPSRTKAPKPEATDRPTPEPPRTPTPEPVITPGPIDTTRGRTPRTGGDALVPGVVVALVALALRSALWIPRHPRLDSNQRPSA
jgi:hypothetical protein